MSLLPYRFASELTQGVVVSRPNRFVMMVREVFSGQLLRCHCPVTGNIGFLDFERGGIPCLLSQNSSPTAKTSHTVEAISLQAIEDTNISWIGINQNKANRVVEHFALSGLFSHAKFSDFIDVSEKHLQREVKVGKSRIDLCIRHIPKSITGHECTHYVEVKTPLSGLYTATHPNFDEAKKKRANGFSGRLPKHMNDLADTVSPGGISPTMCTMILLFMYDAPPFQPTTREALADEGRRPDSYTRNLLHVLDSAERMRISGVSTWQLNLEMTSAQINFGSFFPVEPLLLR